jgi:hypothetical protein
MLLSASLQIPSESKDFLIMGITFKVLPEDMIKVSANESKDCSRGHIPHM